jgi:ATP-dependent DNA helicase RecQ
MKVVEQLEALLSGRNVEQVIERPDQTWSVEYAVWRLWRAKVDHPNAIQDHAVLIRQCIRWLGGSRVRCDGLNPVLQEALVRVGVNQSASGYLAVSPYRPEWLAEGDLGESLDELPSMAIIDESVSAEEWLRRITGKASWRSPAQKEACWKALTAAPGSTTLIGLPTGAGKSLVFQVVAASYPGLTVVVVPTVALGIDQLAVAKAMPSAEILNPQTYDSDGGADVVRDLVANRNCRLVFSSPEACVSGRLRSVLDDHAASGWLRTVVVDEAHIVESWGADFRIEFQLLGALVRNWRARTNHQCRTLLLSATFADSTRNMLKGIFTEPTDSWREYVVQRLRPEIRYHIKSASAEQQVEWITDAVRFLPRPLILYVTERIQAEEWRGRLQSLGLKRLESFHGDTNKSERKRIMDWWRDDRVDLMVATSAFGMGVDKPDVRAVLHACFPESIDRFYQEVGRGGRDGATTNSLMIYTHRDKRVGRQLAPTLLRPATINDRWQAIWDSRQAIEEGVFRVRTDARRLDFVGVRTYQENVRWNKRLLQMLHRAKILTVVNLVTERSDSDSADYIEWAHIQNIQIEPLNPRPGDMIDEVRTSELSTIHRGYQALESCANGHPVCKELREYYGPTVVRACGSCHACRIDGEPRRTSSALEWPEELITTKPRVQIVPIDRPTNHTYRAKWVMAVRQVINCGEPKRLVVHRADLESVTSIIRDAVGASTNNKIYRLDVFDRRTIAPIDINENIVALHPFDFREELKAYNTHGAACAHWMARDQIEDSFGRWRFIHDNSMLLDDVSTWLNCQ